MAHLPANLYEVLHVFATLKIRRPVEENPCFASSNPDDYGHTATPNPIISARHRHLRLLNEIALLLVTEGPSDVVAVTVTNHAHGKVINTVFHMIKNRECKAKERSYYRNFITMINDKEMDAPTMLKSLARLVLENCRGTIISRAQKLQKVVNEFKKSQGTGWQLSSPVRGAGYEPSI